MKLLIEKGILLEALTNVMRAISPRNIIPILNGIKFDLTKEGLSLTASDSDLVINTFISKDKIKKIDKTGNIIIQSKYLLEMVRKLPNTDIKIEVVDGLKIIISTDNTIYNLNCLNQLDYPQITFEQSDNPIVISSEILKKVIRQTLFAVSIQESRPLLTGLNFKINGNIFECVATDSYRLAKKTIVLDKDYENYDLVIPGKNIGELDKIITDEDIVKIHLFNNKIIFFYKDYIFQSSLLSGSYPNTANLIPSDFEIILTTSLEGYYAAIDRAALLTQNKDKNVVKMETKNQEVLITSYASEIGKAEETVTVNKNNSNNLSISFSSKYMLEALKTFEEEDLIILLNNDNMPIVLKSAKDESLIQLILPIKTY